MIRFDRFTVKAQDQKDIPLKAVDKDVKDAKPKQEKK